MLTNELDLCNPISVYELPIHQFTSNSTKKILEEIFEKVEGGYPLFLYVDPIPKKNLEKIMYSFRMSRLSMMDIDHASDIHSK